MKHYLRVIAGIGMAVAAIAGASSASAQSSCTAAQTSQVFSFTGASQPYTVPAGVVSINMYISGAQGGTGGGTNPGAGGLGGKVTGKLNVTAGDTLYVHVGGRGSVFNGAALGGNAGGGIGGGASDVRLNTDAVVNRVAVAGGGGGGGTTGCDEGSATTFGGGGAGGVGGGGAGTAGGDSATSGGVAGGGAGGTLGVGGAAGIGCGGFLGVVGSASGAGGDGQTCCCFFVPSIPGGGGGGGGDMVGGGGGGGSAGTTSCSGNSKGAGGGGGGGSSMATGLTQTSILNGVQTGDGSVELCLTKEADLAITNTNSSTTAVIGVTATYTIQATNAGPAGVVSATVSHIMPAACTSLRWSCVGAGGATCSASGNGSINDAVSMPSGTTLTYVASCLVSATASGVLSGSATIAAPFDVTDLNLANNTAVGSATLVTPAVAQAAAATGGGSVAGGSNDSGGCTMGSTDAPFDPSLPLLVLLAMAGILKVRRNRK